MEFFPKYGKFQVISLIKNVSFLAFLDWDKMRIKLIKKEGFYWLM